MITGPRYLESTIQAKACANWLNSISVDNSNNVNNNNNYSANPLPKCLKEIYSSQRKVSRDNLVLLMKCNLSRPGSGASIVSYNIKQGIPICRSLLCELAEKIPIVGELADTITPQYLADLYCMARVSSTLVESQLHRELVSGTSFPVGYQTLDPALETDFEGYIRKVDNAKEAIISSKHPHHFLSITKLGQVAIIGTTGNEDTFIILQFAGPIKFSNKQLQALLEKTKNEKILLDVGTLNSENYQCKLDLTKRLIADNQNVLGVAINSGDEYISQQESQHESKYNSLKNELENKKSPEYGSFFEKLFDRFKLKEQPTVAFEDLIYANKFIFALDEFIETEIN